MARRTNTASKSSHRRVRRGNCFIRIAVKLARIYFSHEPNKDAAYRRTIFYELKEWGGVYIKFLQIIAGMSKFMEGWSGPSEMTVFSQAPYELLDVRDYVDISKFSEISDGPVAAGSFALVYRGRLQTGEDVAIKILRPSIVNSLAHDLKILRKLCHFFARFMPQYLVDYNDAYEVCAKMFLLETDYARERANQKYFAELYRDSPNVKIPYVYENLSNERAIVQEFIEGLTLSDAMSQATPRRSAAEIVKERTGSDLWEQVVVAGGEALYMAMCADYVFGDPHPGNIVLLPENRIAFVDFGVVANKPPSHHAFANWVESYAAILDGEGTFDRLLETTVTCFTPNLALAMRRLIFDDGDLLNILARSMSEKLEIEMKGNQNYLALFADGHLMDVFMQVASSKVIEVDINEVNFELLKAIQAFLGSVTILDNAQVNRDFSGIMRRSMRYALDAAKQVGIAHDSITTTRMSLTESYEMIVNTLSSLASADEMMFNLVKERIFI